MANAGVPPSSVRILVVDHSEPWGGEILNREMQQVWEWEMKQEHLAIELRAYELFEARGCENGHDWEDWFRAESELLRPVSIAISESDDWISIRANVLGFDEKELKVAVEPRRITILGKKLASVTETEGGKLEYIDWSPDLLMKFIDLETDVLPDKVSVEFQSGVLSIELPKVAKHKESLAAAA